MESQTQNRFEASFLWKVSLKILNSGKILKTFTHVFISLFVNITSVFIYPDNAPGPVL